MADGVAITSGTGTTIATDDAGASGHVQIVKLALSADGSAAAIAADANGLLVNLGANNDVTVTGTVSAAQQGAWAVTSTIANTVTIDSELPAAAALADDTANPTVPGVGAFAHVYDGSTWDRLRGTAADGVLVNLGSNNDVTVSNTVAVEIIDGISVSIADVTVTNAVDVAGDLGPVEQIDLTNSNPVLVAIVDGSGDQITAFGGGTQYTEGDTDASITGTAMLMEVAANALAPVQGTVADGLLVNLGSNNDVAVSGSVTANAGTNLNTSALALESGGNLAAIAASASVLDDWDNGASDGASVSGDVAHDTADAGEPVKIGAKAVAHGSNPTAVDAGDRTNLYANRHGIPFMLGGHPNIITTRANYSSAQTDTAIVSASAGQKIVVTRISVLADKANSVDVAARVGFGTANTPTGDGVVLSHPGIAAGSGVVEGNGSGILGIGADAADLRITSEAATSGSIDVVVSYFIIES
jgi:hypothetical protein